MSMRMVPLRLAILGLISIGSAAQVSGGPAGTVVRSGYPEYRVEGKPFFPYIAGFFYERIPADLWAPAMVRLRKAGFNTLDLYVNWNWHQPREDAIDLDGHTNPRRNLKHVLELAASLGMKAVLRPGPYTFNEWRNGGYPDWLLRKPGSQMTAAAIAEGWLPVASSVQYFDSEAAATMWLDNHNHWEYAAKWFAALWKTLGPFSSTRHGPVLAMQIDDDLAIGYYNYQGPKFWQYLHRNEEIIRQAGVDVPLFINAAFMRDTATSGHPPQGADPLWVIGQWYMRGGSERLERDEALGMEYGVGLLKTQAAVPPMLIEFNTNQYAGPKETHAQVFAPPRDMLLASRILYQNGLRGITIYPALDTLNPAGWEFPPGNYHYTWESAFDAGLKERRERAFEIDRDGALIDGLGSLLAATHERADAALIYSVTSYSTETLKREDMTELARRLLATQKLCDYAHISTQFVDIANQPLESLARYKIAFLPAAPLSGGEISETSQQKLLDYVRQGGKLVVVPDLPAGGRLQQVAAKVSKLSAALLETVQVDPVLTLGNFRPAKSAGNKQEQRKAIEAVTRLVDAAVPVRAARPRIEADDPADEYLYTTLQEANEGSFGFVAATNWNDGARSTSLRVTDPKTKSLLTLPNVTVPGRDSVLLPVRIALNRLIGSSGFADDEELFYSTAEVTAAHYANRMLTLDIYAPADSQIVVRMNQPPLGNCESGEDALRTFYDHATRLARIEVPAGAPPEFRRSVRIPFPFQPAFQLRAPRSVLAGDVFEVRVAVANPGEQRLKGPLVLETPESWPKVEAQNLDIDPAAISLPAVGSTLNTFVYKARVPGDAIPGSEWTLRSCLDGSLKACSEPERIKVVDPVSWRVTPVSSFPVRRDVHLETRPLLWSITLPGEARFELALQNSLDRPVDAKLEFEGEALRFETESKTIALPPGKEITAGVTVFPRPPTGSTHTATGVYPFAIRVQTTGHTTEIPARLVGIRQGEALAYWYDWDRDGFEDLVLENEHLRAIVMLGAGGRGFGLIDKRTGRNAFDSVGGLRDAFSKKATAYTWNGHDLLRPPWRWRELMLTNRQATVRILQPSGAAVKAELRYEADDVPPAGARITKAITLRADSYVLAADYEIVPAQGDKDQTFRSGVSTEVAAAPQKGGEFLAPQLGQVRSYPFVPKSSLTFAPRELDASWFAISDPESGAMLGVFWEGMEQLALETQRSSALLELVSPRFDQPRPYRFRIGYSFQHDGIDELQRSYESFRKP